jgi:hypothetical protein
MNQSNSLDLSQPMGDIGGGGGGSDGDGDGDGGREAEFGLSLSQGAGYANDEQEDNSDEHNAPTPAHALSTVGLVQKGEGVAPPVDGEGRAYSPGTGGQPPPEGEEDADESASDVYIPGGKAQDGGSIFDLLPMSDVDASDTSFDQTANSQHQQQHQQQHPYTNTIHEETESEFEPDSLAQSVRDSQILSLRHHADDEVDGDATPTRARPNPNNNRPAVHDQLPPAVPPAAPASTIPASHESSGSGGAARQPKRNASAIETDNLLTTLDQISADLSTAGEPHLHHTYPTSTETANVDLTSTRRVTGTPAPPHHQQHDFAIDGNRIAREHFTELASAGEEDEEVQTVLLFRQKFALEDDIGSHACSLEAVKRS